MGKLNKYGLKIVGIQSASSDTRELGNTGRVNIVKYNRETGKVWVAIETSSTYYRFAADCPVIEVCRSTRHMTMQEIADEIHRAVTQVA